MFFVGSVLGMIVLFADIPRPATQRKRSMSDAQAVGYRAALGEDPLTMLTRSEPTQATDGAQD